MTVITLRVLDGADRGRIYSDLSAPVTIGREEGNSIQLNDERVSRFHIKIQEDHEKLVLTDLESTNGTKVNGEDIQLRILRYGDMITVGRSVLLFGTREQIAERLARLRGEDPPAGKAEKFRRKKDDPSGSGLNTFEDYDFQAKLHLLDPPDLPDRMSPAQAAQLAEMLEYLHVRIRNLLQSAQSDGKSARVSVDARQWQNLLDIQARLAEYLRGIGEPNETDF
jgi:hypothetical protein